MARKPKAAPVTPAPETDNQTPETPADTQSTAPAAPVAKPPRAPRPDNRPPRITKADGTVVELDPETLKPVDTSAGEPAEAAPPAPGPHNAPDGMVYCGACREHVPADSALATDDPAVFLCRTFCGSKGRGGIASKARAAATAPRTRAARTPKPPREKKVTKNDILRSFLRQPMADGMEPDPDGRPWFTPLQAAVAVGYDPADPFTQRNIAAMVWVLSQPHRTTNPIPYTYDRNLCAWVRTAPAVNVADHAAAILAVRATETAARPPRAPRTAPVTPNPAPAPSADPMADPEDTMA